MKKLILLFICSLVFSACTTDSQIQDVSLVSSKDSEPINHEATNHSIVLNDEKDFLLAMIPHHLEAIETSQIIAELTDDPEIKEFALGVISVQAKEVEQMEHWLQDWYGVEFSNNSIYLPMMGDLSEGGDKELEQQYLEDMIDHHNGAIEMARRLAAINSRAETKEMAEAIISVQSEEVVMLQEWLSTKFGNLKSVNINENYGTSH